MWTWLSCPTFTSRDRTNTETSLASELVYSRSVSPPTTSKHRSGHPFSLKAQCFSMQTQPQRGCCHLLKAQWSNFFFFFFVLITTALLPVNHHVSESQSHLLTSCMLCSGSCCQEYPVEWDGSPSWLRTCILRCSSAPLSRWTELGQSSCWARAVSCQSHESPTDSP